MKLEWPLDHLTKTAARDFPLPLLRRTPAPQNGGHTFHASSWTHRTLDSNAFLGTTIICSPSEIIRHFQAEQDLAGLALYCPYRDGAIAEVEGGKPESIWACKTQVRARVIESAQETILASALVAADYFLRMKSVAGDEGLKAVSLQGLPAPLQPLGPVDVNRIVHCVFPLSCR